MQPAIQVLRKRESTIQIPRRRCSCQVGNDPGEIRIHTEVCDAPVNDGCIDNETNTSDNAKAQKLSGARVHIT